MTSDTVKVWDGWIRLFHWTIVLIIPAMWWTAENGEMTWHMRLGTVLLALLLFRILWGFFGSSTARFGSFVKGPGAVISYLTGNRREGAAGIGHNPAGGWSVLVLLGVMLAQVGLGLFSGDPYDGATGPLNHIVGAMTAGWMTDWHEIGFNVLLSLIALHIAAILYYLLVKHENLVTPMVTGKREGQAETGGIESASLMRAVVCFAVAAAVPIWIWFVAD
ncbi:cytochrome b/b6 domain-containing protein [Aurantiacibacter odishensis]|uniref:cytochrome b/b6 domain-containing protein n=1 Tax=Aurantiacibacter odishensis TaxID=1155476 RepID=UPI000E74D0F4|nr:cytochrome b/b6 domain-containing protein [Aurantiacibacter odishensis]